jgi:uracil-DNA glycosylase
MHHGSDLLTQFLFVRSSAQRGRFRNRRPTKKELGTYGRFVLADIASVQPKVVGALGTSAAALFGALLPVEQARGRSFQFQGIPVHVTYHPGFVLRFGGRGSRLWRSAVRDLSWFWSEARAAADQRDAGRKRLGLTIRNPTCCSKLFLRSATS